MKQATARLSTRQKFAGDNHHLWNNNGTWWFHGTVHLPDGTAERVRTSLRTKCVEEARQLRDRVFTSLGAMSRTA